MHLSVLVWHPPVSLAFVGSFGIVRFRSSKLLDLLLPVGRASLVFRSLEPRGGLCGGEIEPDIQVFRTMCWGGEGEPEIQVLGTMGGCGEGEPDM